MVEKTSLEHQKRRKKRGEGGSSRIPRQIVFHPLLHLWTSEQRYNAGLSHPHREYSSMDTCILCKLGVSDALE
jgi:hypothetical protein